MTALRARDATGRGQVIDLAIIEPILTDPRPAADRLRPARRRPAAHRQPLGRTTPRATPTARADGSWVAISTSAQSIAERVMRLVGRPELIDEPWFATGAERAAARRRARRRRRRLDRRARPRRGRRRVREGRGGGRPDLRRRATCWPTRSTGARTPSPRSTTPNSGRCGCRTCCSGSPRPRAASDWPGRASASDTDGGARRARRSTPTGSRSCGRRGRLMTRPAARPDLALRPGAPPGAAGQGAVRPAPTPWSLDLEDAVPAEAKERARDAGGARSRPCRATKPRVGARQRRRHPLVARGRPRRPGRRRPRRRARAQGRRPGDDRGARAAPGPAAAPAARDRRSASSGPTRWPRRSRSVLAVSLGEADLAADLGCPAPGRAGVGAPACRRRVPGRRDRRADAPASGPTSPTRTGSSTTAREARDQGFFGRSVIHPQQVGRSSHAAFTPSADEVTDARALPRLAHRRGTGARGGRVGRRAAAASSTPPSSPAPTASLQQAEHPPRHPH